MLHTTRGIAIHSVKFSETSIIVKIYTESFGLRSYIIKGIRKEHSRVRPGLFQPLTLLDLTVYNKEKSTLQTIREASIAIPYQSIPFDIVKSSIALFTSELLLKTIREEEQNPELFRFLWEFCTEMDSSKASLHLFPLIFIIRLTRYLGILPRQDYSSSATIFNLQEGSFQKDLPDHNQYLENPLSSFLFQLLTMDAVSAGTILIPSQARGILLEKMLLYYKIHLTGFHGVQSHTILHTVLS